MRDSACSRGHPDDMERNVGLPQQVEPLVDEPDVELVVGVGVQMVRERARLLTWRLSMT